MQADKRFLIFGILILFISGCSSSPSLDSTGYKQTPEYMRSNLQELFDKYEVDVVFTGHDHNYQRSYPLKEGKVSEEGTVYIVGGVGGSQLRNLGQADWQAKTAMEHHFIFVTINGEKANFRVVNKYGRVIDRFEIDKS